MRKGYELIGMTVTGQEDGTLLGRVRDLIFDNDASCIRALVLGEKDLFGLVDAQVVPWEKVRSVGTEVVSVSDGEAKMRLHDDENIASLATRETAVSGTHIFTASGTHLGTLADMFIDEETGQVSGYEISGGFVSDTLHGKKFLAAPPHLAFGRDVAIASTNSVEQLTT